VNAGLMGAAQAIATLDGHLPEDVNVTIDWTSAYGGVLSVWLTDRAAAMNLLRLQEGHQDSGPRPRRPVRPPGSGKTYTALTWAAALGKTIALIDTERGSASLYADLFDFDVLDLAPPYHPHRLIEALAKPPRRTTSPSSTPPATSGPARAAS
jgi:hypothetical protein